MDTLPDVTLTAIDGQPLRLKDQPLPLVVYFYPKDDTAGCTREAQDFSAMAGEFASAGVVVIGVSKDPPAKHEKFVAKYDLAVALASDEDGSACEAFGTWVEKSMYGRRYMGIERATFLFGRDGQLARAWRKVKVPGHAAEVLAAARAL
ncbi:peroxiredoxin [Sphingomonas sp. ABOLG]|jgi:peroxiredoxin Q/BCP|uniref:thioredoxin-dependent peroxiredoxin n=1 Tax=Sphingomonas olei TaxID=1886787 RepID=A0ABY2QGT3_9SPHN|nr:MULTISPECIES: peroxiredoxin [Sphingomonas]KKI17815.1 alkyl hydroperoxide reductase [Sphingomonas sp. Ag1]RSV16892.1 peroxiredoxin [Sphingomonas sp. ABOLG]THG39870.1 peroxiredoxin [Sphingomonas olei]